MVSSPSLSFPFKCRVGTGVFDWLDFRCIIYGYITSIALVHLKKKSNLGLFVRRLGFFQRIIVTSIESHGYSLGGDAMTYINMMPCWTYPCPTCHHLSDCLIFYTVLISETVIRTLKFPMGTIIAWHLYRQCTQLNLTKPHVLYFELFCNTLHTTCLRMV